MDDLISRQDAIDAVRQFYDEFMCYDNGKSIEEIIAELPPAQPELVWCKDCKHWGIHKRLNIPWCREMHIDRGAEDFCSMAERRE